MKSVFAVLMIFSASAFGLSHSRNNLTTLECTSENIDSKGFFIMQTKNGTNSFAAYIDGRELSTAKISLTGSNQQNAFLSLLEKHPITARLDLVGVANLNRSTLKMRIDWISPVPKQDIPFSCKILTDKQYGIFPEEGSVEYWDNFMEPIFELLDKKDEWKEKIQADFKM